MGASKTQNSGCSKPSTERRVIFRLSGIVYRPHPEIQNSEIAFFSADAKKPQAGRCGTAVKSRRFEHLKNTMPRKEASCQAWLLKRGDKRELFKKYDFLLKPFAYALRAGHFYRPVCQQRNHLGPCPAVSACLPPGPSLFLDLRALKPHLRRSSA